MSFQHEVDFPTIVKEALDVFGDLFSNESARQYFAEYLTGLMVAEHKTVSGINREFAITTDQSYLNRWLTEVPWDEKALNDRRLVWLQRNPKTCYSRRGVIAIDNTLVEHSGKLIEDVGWFWDHADQRYLIAHDYIISNYVCASGAHYPIDWGRFRKKDACDDGQFKDHTELCIELIDDAICRDIRVISLLTAILRVPKSLTTSMTKSVPIWATSSSIARWSARGER